MKIKITLIAFFASVLVLTSCMKNEVSPGIEQVRAAYAALLNAKATAEVTLANANAAFLQAQAAVEQADAAYRLAEADSLAAKAEEIRAELANDMAIWALELDSIAKEMEKEIADLQRQMQEDLDDDVAAYLQEYIDALNDVLGLQNDIVDKMAAMAALDLDLANGTMNYMDDLLADLAAANAAMDALEAEYALAVSLLGNVDAALARIAELEDEETQLGNEKLTLTAQMAEIEHDADAEEEDMLDALDDYNDAKDDLADAKADLANAEAIFPLPDFWQDAIDSLEFVEDSLQEIYDDTLASYTAWNDAVELIANGTDDLDEDIADLEDLIAGAEDSIALYEDTIQMYVDDTADAFNAWEDAIDELADARQDTADWHAELLVVTDSLTDQRDRYTNGGPNDGDPALFALITQNAADSTLLEAQITVAEITTIPDLVDDSTDAADAFTDALADYNADVPGYEAAIGDLEDNIDMYEDLIDDVEALIVIRLADIAQAELDLPDLYSEYLHWQSYIEEMVAWRDAVSDYKESLRADYEEYKDDYWYAFLDELQAAIDDATDAVAETKALYLAAKAVYDEAREPYTDLEDLWDAADERLAIVQAILTAWGDVDDFNQNYLDVQFTAAMADAQDDIDDAQDAIDQAELDYIAGKINYDKFMNDLAQLQAELAAAQNAVNYWKALLDEALAN